MTPLCCSSAGSVVEGAAWASPPWLAVGRARNLLSLSRTKLSCMRAVLDKFRCTGVTDPPELVDMIMESPLGESLAR